LKNFATGREKVAIEVMILIRIQLHVLTPVQHSIPQVMSKKLMHVSRINPLEGTINSTFNIQ